MNERADRRQKHNKHSHGAAQKHLDNRDGKSACQFVATNWSVCIKGVFIQGAKHLFSSLERF